MIGSSVRFSETILAVLAKDILSVTDFLVKNSLSGEGFFLRVILDSLSVSGEMPSERISIKHSLTRPFKAFFVNLAINLFLSILAIRRELGT